MVLLLWCIAEDPGPILWVTGNAKEATKFAKARLMPMVEKCGPIIDKIPTDRYGKTTTAIYFPGAPLYIAGADSPLALQSTPFRYIFLDEVRSWKDGALEMVSKRVRSYAHSYKKVIVSTPATAGDKLHRAYLQGSQSKWHFDCPKCDQSHEFGWGDPDKPGGLKWDCNDQTKPQGEWDLNKVIPTIRYECPHCDASWTDTPKNRKMISRMGHWEDTNPKAPANTRSYTWHAMLPYWPSWGKDLVTEFLKATKAMKQGAWHPLKDHLNETRGEVWDESRRFERDDELIDARVTEYPVGDFQLVDHFAAPKNPLQITSDWTEVRRIMSVDVQAAGGRHFYVVVRSWSNDGRSRLLYHAKANSWDELRTIQEDWKVHPNYVCIDAAWTAGGEVYQEILNSRNQWKAFKGDDKEFFTTTDPSGIRVRRIWQKSLADPGMGTGMQGQLPKIPLYLFSKPSTIDRLNSFIHGIAPGWEIPPMATDDYRSQVTAYYLHEFVDNKGNTKYEWRTKRKDDHYADCERIQIACAAIHGLLQF